MLFPVTFFETPVQLFTHSSASNCSAGMKVHVNYFVFSEATGLPLDSPSIQWAQWWWRGWGLKLTSHLPLMPELYSCRPVCVPHRHRHTHNYTWSTQQDRFLPNSRIKLVYFPGKCDEAIQIYNLFELSPCYCPQAMMRKDPSTGQKKADVMEQLSGVLDCVLDRTGRNRGEREAVEGSGRGLIWSPEGAVKNRGEPRSE